MPGVSLLGTGFTAAETGEGGSVDNARSTILLTAPAWARASFFINLENGGYLIIVCSCASFGDENSCHCEGEDGVTRPLGWPVSCIVS